MTGTSEVRRAALVLHGLTPADREWVLERLPPSSCEELQPLLDELASLGMPGDPELIRSALQRVADGAQGVEPAFAVIAHASSEHVYDILVDEPDRLIAIVMSSSNWPWRDALLSRIDAARAQGIRERMMTLSVAPGLRRAVLQELARRIGEGVATRRAPEAMPEPATIGLGGLRRRIGERLQAWRR
jgi:hypothetical protein